MVEAVADYEAPYTLLSHGDLADNLQRWLGSHRAWLRDDQATALEALFARSAEIEQGEIDEDQAQALVQQLVGFERLDESFAYVR